MHRFSVTHTAMKKVYYCTDLLPRLITLQV